MNGAEAMLRSLMTEEEAIVEFGTIEQKRTYVAKMRLENPNWVNTIFPRGKYHRGVPYTPCHKGLYRRG